MDSETRCAALRLLALSNLPIDRQKAHVRMWPELGWDGILVAKALLAENHASDDLEATEERLLAIGFKRYETGSGCWSIYHDGLGINLGGHVGKTIDSKILEWAWPCQWEGKTKTMGDVRRLIEALYGK